MTRFAVTVFGLAVLAAFSLGPLARAAAITQTVTAGPGTSLISNGTLTFYVTAPGPVTFDPSLNSAGFTCPGGGIGCLDINDRILLTTATVTDSAVSSGGGVEPIVTSTICSGPPQNGFVKCTDSFSPGQYSVALQFHEVVSPAASVSARSGSVSVTISGPTVAATPEPGTLGLMALAFGTAGVVSRRRLRRSTPRLTV